MSGETTNPSYHPGTSDPASSPSGERERGESAVPRVARAGAAVSSSSADASSSAVHSHTQPVAMARSLSGIHGTSASSASLSARGESTLELAELGQSSSSRSVAIVHAAPATGPGTAKQLWQRHRVRIVVAVATVLLAVVVVASVLATSSSSSSSSSSTPPPFVFPGAPSSKQLSMRVEQVPLPFAGASTLAPELAAVLDTDPGLIEVSGVSQVPSSGATFDVTVTLFSPRGREAFVRDRDLARTATAEGLLERLMQLAFRGDERLTRIGFSRMALADVGDPIALPPVCSRLCSGRGVCKSGSCLCDAGFAGPSCEVACPCRAHGVCNATTGACECDAGFAPPQCVGGAVQLILRSSSGSPLPARSTRVRIFAESAFFEGIDTYTSKAGEALFAEVPLVTNAVVTVTSPEHEDSLEHVFNVTAEETTTIDVTLEHLLPRLASSSPSNGEGDVAMTRETVIAFTAPLDPTSSDFEAALSVSSAAGTIAHHVHVDPSRTEVTLFYPSLLPPSSRIQVSINGSYLLDSTGRAIDVDSDGVPGGFARLFFDTLTVTTLPGTAVCGRVFKSELVQGSLNSTVNLPLANVTITVDGREDTLFAHTDAQGNFRLEPAPAGRFFVHIDGRTADTDRPDGAYYPFVGKAWHAEPGLVNNIGTVFLPLVPPGSLQPVSNTRDTTIGMSSSVTSSNPEFKDVSITVPAGSLYTPLGGRGGQVGLAPVSPSRLPGTLPPTLNFPIVITVQATAPNFDIPAPVCFPVLPDPVTGVRPAPNSESAIWSFNHDTGRFEMVGPSTVTSDGTLVCSNPGVGIRAPGWHADSPTTEVKNQCQSPPPCTPSFCRNGGKCRRSSCDRWCACSWQYAGKRCQAFSRRPRPGSGDGNDDGSGDGSGDDGGGGGEDPECKGDPVAKQSAFNNMANAVGSCLADLLKLDQVVDCIFGIGKEAWNLKTALFDNFASMMKAYTTGSAGPAIEALVRSLKTSKGIITVAKACAETVESRLTQSVQIIKCASDLVVKVTDLCAAYGAGAGAPARCQNPACFSVNSIRTPARVLNTAADLAEGLLAWTKGSAFRGICAAIDQVANWIVELTGQAKLKGDMVLRLQDARPSAEDVQELYRYMSNFTGISINESTPIGDFDYVVPSELQAKISEASTVSLDDIQRALAGMQEVSAAMREEAAGTVAAELDHARSRFDYALTFVQDRGQGRKVTTTLRGQSSPQGAFEGVFIPSRITFVMQACIPQRQVYGATSAQAAGPGEETRVKPPLMTSWDDLPDTDGDGLPDVCEFVLGTNEAEPDTDEDGIDDFTELLQGSDPLGGRVAVAGPIASVPLNQGAARDLCIVNDLVVVVSSASALEIFSAFNGMEPLALGGVRLPSGMQTLQTGAVKCSAVGARVLVAVPTVGVFTLVYDISDVRNPTLWRTVQTDAQPVALEFEGGILYLGLHSGAIAAFQLETALPLGSVDANVDEVIDMSIAAGVLYVGVTQAVLALPLPLRFDQALQGGQLISRVEMADAVHSLVCGAGTCFVPLGHDQFAMLSLRGDRTVPTLSSSGTVSGSVLLIGWGNAAVTGSGTLVSTSRRSPKSERDVMLWDVSTTEQPPLFLAGFDTECSSSRVRLANGLSYVANAECGLEVINYLSADVSRIPPTVSLVHANPNPALPAGHVEEYAALALFATVFDNVQVRNVEFWVDGRLVAVDGDFPFQFALTAPPVAQQTNLSVSAVARDTGGYWTRSEVLNFTIAPDRTPPYAFQTIPSAATRLPVDTLSRIAVIVSEPIDPARLLNSSAAVTLTKTPTQVFGAAAGPAPAPESVPLVISYVAASSTIVADLESGTAGVGDYRLTLDAASVVDLAGNAVAGNLSFAFRVSDSISRLTFGSVAVGALYPVSDGTTSMWFRVDGVEHAAALGLLEPVSSKMDTRAWRFGDGSTVADESPLANDELLVSSASFEQGALQLGSGSTLELPLQFVATEVTAYNVSMRVKFSGQLEAGPVLANRFLELVYLWPDGELGLFFREVGQVTTGPGTVVLDTWYTIVFAFTQSRVDLFVDGVSVADNVAAGNAFWTSNTLNLARAPWDQFGEHLKLFESVSAMTVHVEELSLVVQYRGQSPLTHDTLRLGIVQGERSHPGTTPIRARLTYRGAGAAAERVTLCEATQSWPWVNTDDCRLPYDVPAELMDLRVEVEAEPTAAGSSFQVVLSSLPQRLADVPVLPYGYMAADLVSPVETHWYQFHAERGQRVTLAVLLAGDKRVSVRLHLARASNLTMAAGATIDRGGFLSGDAGNYVSRVTPYTGTYYASVRHVDFQYGQLSPQSFRYVLHLTAGWVAGEQLPLALDGQQYQVPLLTGESHTFVLDFAELGPDPFRALSVRMLRDPYSASTVDRKFISSNVLVFADEEVPRSEKEVQRLEPEACDDVLNNMLEAPTDVGDEFVVACACPIQDYAAYGNILYSGGSSVCSAAVLAGALAYPYRGEVVLRIAPCVYNYAFSVLRFGFRFFSLEEDEGNCFYFPGQAALLPPELRSLRLVRGGEGDRFVPDIPMPQAGKYYVWVNRDDFTYMMPNRFLIGVSTQLSRGPTPIPAVNSRVYSRWASVGDVHEWTFEAREGEGLEWEVFLEDTRASLVKMPERDSDVYRYELAQGGTYALQVAPNLRMFTPQSPRYSFILHQAPPQGRIPALAFGVPEALAWNTSLPGEKARLAFSFVLAEEHVGRKLSITVDVPSTRRYNWRLIRNGEPVADTHLELYRTTPLRDWEIASSGMYEVFVWQHDDTRRKTYVGVSDQPEAGHVLDMVDRQGRLQGYIGFGDVDTFRFHATAGEVIYVRFVQYSSAVVCNLEMEESGETAWAVDDANFPSSYEWTVPATGAVLVRLGQSPRLDSTLHWSWGAYDVQLLFVPTYTLQPESRQVVRVHNLRGAARFAVDASAAGGTVVVESVLLLDGDASADTQSQPTCRVTMSGGNPGSNWQGRRSVPLSGFVLECEFEDDAVYAARTLLVAVSSAYGAAAGAAQTVAVDVGHVHPVTLSGLAPVAQFKLVASASEDLTLALHGITGDLQVFDESTGASVGSATFAAVQGVSYVVVCSGAPSVATGWLSVRRATSPAADALPVGSSWQIPSSGELEADRTYGLLFDAVTANETRVSMVVAAGDVVRVALQRENPTEWALRLDGNVAEFGARVVVGASGTLAVQIKYLGAGSGRSLLSVVKSVNQGAALSAENLYVSGRLVHGGVAAHDVDLAGNGSLVVHALQPGVEIRVALESGAQVTGVGRVVVPPQNVLVMSSSGEPVDLEYSLRLIEGTPAPLAATVEEDVAAQEARSNWLWSVGTTPVPTLYAEPQPPPAPTDVLNSTFVDSLAVVDFGSAVSGSWGVAFPAYSVDANPQGGGRKRLVFEAKAGDDVRVGLFKGAGRGDQYEYSFSVADSSGATVVPWGRGMHEFKAGGNVTRGDVTSYNVTVETRGYGTSAFEFTRTRIVPPLYQEQVRELADGIREYGVLDSTTATSLLVFRSPATAPVLFVVEPAHWQVMEGPTFDVMDAAGSVLAVGVPTSTPRYYTHQVSLVEGQLVLVRVRWARSGGGGRCGFVAKAEVL